LRGAGSAYFHRAAGGPALAAGLSAILVQTGKCRAGDVAKIGLPGAILASDVGAALEKIMELARQN